MYMKTPHTFQHLLLTTIFSVLITGQTAIAAQESSSSIIPNSGLYLGVGASLNSTQFNGQTITGTGLTADTVLGRTAYGIGSGQTGVAMGPSYSIAPSVQVGYFQKLDKSDYLWGAKLNYSYLAGSPSTTYNVNIPQYGFFPNGKPLTGGNAVAGSYQKAITNQYSLIPYFGKSFERSTIYFGVGPTYSQVRSTTNNLVGYAAVDGRTVNVTGAPQSFISSQWVYGGAAMIGGSYFIDSAWFVDLTYTYAMTQNKTSYRDSPFSNPPTTGQLVGTGSGTATIQTLGITLNKLFN